MIRPPMRVPATMRAVLEDVPPNAALSLLEVYALDECEIAPERYAAARRYYLLRRAVVLLQKAHRAGGIGLQADRARVELQSAEHDVVDAREALSAFGWFRAECGHAIDDVGHGEVCEECAYHREQNKRIDLAERIAALPSAFEGKRLVRG